MPTELEELVEFLHHGNTPIRQIAAENLVGYSTSQPLLFKRNQLEPIKDLKLLVKDYAPIAKNALTILVNVSEDGEICENLAVDGTFVESVLRRVTNAKEANADLMCMLLANLAKSEKLSQVITLKRDIPRPLSASPLAIDQLLDCFVKGAEGAYNKDANYDYLSYLFADLAKSVQGRSHFLTPREEGEKEKAETVIPLSKLVVFTEHKSTIRRRGVANTIKNVCFDVHSHPVLLSSEDDHPSGIGLLPYIILPLMGNEEYSLEDSEGMLDECQLLAPDKEREAQSDILCTHLESLLLLTTERESRDQLRKVKVYPIVRELHLQIEDDDVREGCDRLVQVLMRDEEGEGEKIEGKPRIQEVTEEVDEDEQIVDII